MAKTVVIYHSGYGHTQRVAQFVAEGANAELIAIDADGNITDADWSALDAADAIIFGSPTYMGMVSGQLKCLLDASSGRWMAGTWNGKLSAGFTTSLGFSGDKQSTLSYLATFACQHGMLWVGSDAPNGLFSGESMEEATNRLSSNLGVMSQVNFGPEYKPTPGDLKTGSLLGARVAKLAAKLVG